MCAVTVGAADIVAPVLAAPVVVVLLAARMARETSVGDLLGRHRFQDANLQVVLLDRGWVCARVNGRVDHVNVGLAGAVTGLAAHNLALPTFLIRELGVRGVGEVVELIFVTVLTAFAADQISRVDLLLW